MADKPSTLELKVELDCKCCCKKIQKILCKIQVEESITTISYGDKKDIVTISGPFCPQKLKQKLCCKARKSKLKIEITIVLPVEKPPQSPPPPPPPKPLDINVKVKFDPPIQVCCPSSSSCGGNSCSSRQSCGGGCYCSKPSCGGSSCYCGITPCRGSYLPSYGLPPFQLSIEDTQSSCTMM